MTTKNPILDELRATRERLLAESGGTVSGLVSRLQAEQAASDRPQYKGRITNEALTSRGTSRSSRPLFKEPEGNVDDSVG
jgi:hypothetical protein